jgi:hypothetical protein
MRLEKAQREREREGERERETLAPAALLDQSCVEEVNGPWLKAVH